MPRTAAIFDLDRTLIRRASGPAISEALRSVGLMSQRSIPGQGLVFKVFDVIGETRPSMILTRQFARMATGWERTKVQEAGRLVADELEPMVEPFARAAIADHRDEGAVLVVATTTPYDLVKPLADALGFDHVVATRYEEADGFYTGRIDGEFVWGKGKLRAIEKLAAEEDLDLAESYAYSDSYFDRPLLGAVSHGVAVNPDPRLMMLAVLRRWPMVWFDVPPGVPKLAGLVEPQKLIMPFARPELFPYVRFDIDGLDNIADTGPAIIAGNHRSYFDPLAIGMLMARRGRPVRFLGKKEVFDAPVVGDLAKALGGIRVERGTGSDEPLDKAAEALRAGELVAMMPQGTIPRGREFFEPELKGRWGTARLAEMADVPVVPVGLWGTEKVWPRSARLPNMVNVTSPPTVRIRVGKPLYLAGDDPDVDTKELMAAIVDLLPPEAREHREPTADELALSMPSGDTADDAGEADHEAGRRPGSD